MAQEFFVTIVGSKQGQFKGEAAKPHQEKIVGLEFEFEVEVPVDRATGQSTGKRLYTPIVFTKLVGAASPQIFQACANNELLPSVLFEFVHTLPDGTRGVYYTVKLTNAFVRSHKTYKPMGTLGADSSTQSASENHELDEVGLTFKTIEIEHKQAKTAGTDDWAGAGTV